MKFYIKSILKYFSVIYTIASIGAAIFISIFDKNATLGVKIFWELLGSCLLCSLVSTFLLNSQKEWSKKEAIVRIIIHVILIYSIILGSGLSFKWININNIGECFEVSLMFFGIYAGVWIAIYKRDNREAEELNKKIMHYIEKNEK